MGSDDGDDKESRDPGQLTPRDRVENPALPTLVSPVGALGRVVPKTDRSLPPDREAMASVPNRGTSDGRPAPWFLESLTSGGKHLRRMLIYPLPFRIGRVPGLELVLPSQQVSKQHAEIYHAIDGLRLRDLGSTNGTFVNRTLVSECPLREGDVVHFADFEFRVARQEISGLAAADEDGTVRLDNRPLPQQFSPGTRELKELLAQGAITTVFQPIVRIRDRSVVAYEALGRGRHPGLPEDPTELFRIAETLGVEVELSRLFRRKAVESVVHRSDVGTLFLNTHGAEVEQPGLADSLKEVRALAPHLALILEIHESALALPMVMGELQKRLTELHVGLAYDDFGAGQARLIELAEVPPNFLKFDRRFVSAIDRAALSKRRLLASLVAAARELGVETIAEGVETAAEAEVCLKAGFSHAQGFFFGAPLSWDVK